MRKKTLQAGSGEKPCQDGFTLVEVLLCIGIFAVGFLAVISLQVGSMRGNLSARNTTEASIWADNRAEDLLALDYTNPDLDAGTHSEVRDGFTINWTVIENDLDGDLVGDLKEVTIQVTSEGMNSEKNINLFIAVPRD